MSGEDKTTEPATPAAAASITEPILPGTRRGRQLVLGVFALALVLRLGAVTATSPYTPLTDAIDYDRIASSIASEQAFGDAFLPPAQGPSALRAPGYPLALSLVYMIFGEHDWTAGRIQNAVLGTVLVALVGVVAAQLWSRRVAVVAMALAAVHPAMILVGTGLQLEPLLVTLSFGSLAAALQYRRNPSRLRWALAAGLLIGCTILTREIGFLLLPPTAWLVWTAAAPHRPSRAALAAPMALIAVAAAVVVPWTIRNAARLDAFVPVTTSAGFGLAGIYNETAVDDKENPARWLPPYDDPEMLRILTEMENPTEVNIDRELREASIDVIKDHPTYPFRVVLWNTVRLFDLDGGDYSLVAAEFLPYSRRLTRLAVYASYGVLVLAAIGAVDRRARLVPKAVWATPVLIYAFMVVFLPANIRYRASLEPFFVLLASLTIMSVLHRFGLVAPSEHRRPRADAADHEAVGVGDVGDHLHGHESEPATNG